MASNEIILTVDIGTTSTKVLAVRHDGAVLARHAVEYPLHAPLPGRAEQDPDEIVRAVQIGLHAVRKAMDTAPAGICFSSAMHSVIAVDAKDAPLTPSITWADGRAAQQASRLKFEGLATGLHARTGTPVHAMSPLCKLIWLRENEPAVFARAARFISIKEYVLQRLTGIRAVDHSIASSNGTFSLHDLRWDEEALRLAGIDASRLSTPVPTTRVIGTLRADEAAQLGIEPSTPVVIGATDGPLANLGNGAIDPGIFALTLGTSGAVRCVVPAPTADRRGRLFCYALTDSDWVIGGAINNGGIALKWVRETFGYASMDEMKADAMRTPIGANGLRFLPLLSGERFAAFKPTGPAVIHGVTTAHTRADFARAAIEGIGYLLGKIVAALEESTGADAREIRVGGGVLEFAPARQLLADMLGRQVSMPESPEASSLGAAWLGFRALGLDADWSRARAIARPADHPPGLVNHARYLEWRKLCDDDYRRTGVLLD